MYMCDFIGIEKLFPLAFRRGGMGVRLGSIR